MRPVCETLYWLLQLAKTRHPICFLHSISSDDYLEDHATIPHGFVGVWDINPYLILGVMPLAKMFSATTQEAAHTLVR